MSHPPQAPCPSPSLTLGPCFYTILSMEILHLGQELLRQKSLPVEEVNDELRATIQAMFDTMLESEGVGLAAPQVGILQRFFVVIADDDVPRVFINPQIIATSSEMCDYEEGCLSIPNVYEKITRPAKITIQALNEQGRPFTLEAEGFLARVIQHEYDHLEGVLYIDRGDQDFKEKIVQQFQRRAARKAEKEAAKAARAAKVAAKKAKKAGV